MIIFLTLRRMKLIIKLINLTVGNPALEISPGGSLVNLKIWDILIDLEVKIDGLKYSEEQLNKFLF
jgi:hypothetical protein